MSVEALHRSHWGAKGANRNTGKQRENRLDEKQICDMNIYIDEV